MAKPKRSLALRLDSYARAFSAAAAAGALLGSASPSAATVVYSGIRNLSVPRTTSGLYLNIVSGVFNPSPSFVPGWDVNLFGASSLQFYNAAPQYGTVANGPNVANLAYGNIIDGSDATSLASSGALFPTDGTTGYYGFRFQDENHGNAVRYGWARVRNSASGPYTIFDYAYEDSGVGILAGFTEPGGACCHPDGTCSTASAATCTSFQGRWFPGIGCAEADCRRGACCRADGTCSANLVPADCAALSGTFVPGVGCVQANCPQPGACCLSNGTCQMVQQTACAQQGGTFAGQFVACAQAFCYPGACCFPGGTCATRFHSDCDSQGGRYQGNGVSCAQVNCQQLGACCSPNGICTELRTASECTSQAGMFAGAATTCAQAGCQPFGACCSTNGTCTLNVLQSVCLGSGGQFRGPGSDCAGLCPGVWAEDGDAGGIPLTCQVTSGEGSLVQIRGGTSSSTDSDLYLITICDRAHFSATTTGGSPLDTGLCLFDTNGLGLAYNDDDPQGGAQSRLTNQFVPANGRYYLAVSYWTIFPLDTQAGQRIFSATPYNVERPPDGPGARPPAGNGNGILGSWSGTGGLVGTYSIFLTGTCYGHAPSVCYANCDGSFTAPYLNVNDFACFLQKYAAADLYANCDGSSLIPMLNVADFSCFLIKFAAGCSAP
jgi:hypothetical protein